MTVLVRAGIRPSRRKIHFLMGLLAHAGRSAISAPTRSGSETGQFGA